MALEAVVKLYKKVVNTICDVFEFIAILCLVAMLVVVMIQVIGRYVFSVTPGWSEELARQFMIIFSFIGMAIGVRDKVHIAMSVVIDLPLRRIKLPVEIGGKILIMALGIMMSINMGLLFTMLRYNRLPGSGIPIVWIYTIPTAVGVLLALIVIYQIYDHFKYGTDDMQKDAVQKGDTVIGAYK
jgi:TRAP-type C4-dicarboxylate transport system permease small subunit